MPDMSSYSAYPASSVGLLNNADARVDNLATVARW
jgi:hypothetical protein